MSYLHHHQSPHRLSEDLFSIVLSLAVNVLIFLGFVAMDRQADVVEEQPEHVQWVSLTALGKEMPKALPRIVTAEEAAVEEAPAVSISRTVEDKKVEPPPQADAKKDTPPPAKKPPPKRKRKRKRRPKKGSLESLFSRDERADRGKRRGHSKGYRGGTSTEWQNSTEMSIYLTRVSTLIQRRFNTPATLSKSQLRKLSTTIKIRINSSGRVIGTPQWKKKSGNKFYDNASLRAIDPFLASQGVDRLPLPKKKSLKKMVLKKGFNIILEGKNIR